MSKKVLALLVVASAFCAFACDSDDDNATTCTNGAKQCSGNKVQVCVKNAWKDTTTCPNACVKGVCASDATDTDTDTDKDKDQTGACTATSTAECTSACNADKTAGYYWSANDNKVKEYECYTGKSCVVDSASGKVSCVADSSGGSTTSCTGSEVTTGGTVGQCCNRDTYQQTCINGNANALVCWDGAVTQWTCANNKCTANETKPLQVVCSNDSSSGGGSGSYTPTGETCDSSTDTTKTCTDANTVKYCYKDGKWYTRTCNSCTTNADNTYYCCDGNNDKCTGSSSGGDTTTEDCTATSTAKCNAVCASDGNGYYWNSKTNEIGTKECAKNNQTCENNNGSLSCKTQTTGEACDSTTVVPECQENATKVKYCSSSSNEYVVKDCAQCYVDAEAARFYCNGDQNLATCTATSTSKCEGACIDDTTGYFWSNDTVNKKECTGTKKCTVSKTGFVDCE